MNGFPPNLDDGELWIPSDIILDVGGVAGRPNGCCPPPFLPVEPPSATTYVLQSAATAAGVPLFKPSSKAASNLQGLMGGRQTSRFEPPLIHGDVFGGLRPPEKALVTGQGACFGAVPSGLATTVAGQRRPNPVRGRFLPVGTGVSLDRDREGTGVFLPRVSNAPSNNSNGETKKKSLGKRGEQQLRYARGSLAVWKQRQQQCLSFQSTAEIGLPQDWTY